jgi:hypothetical protein
MTIGDQTRFAIRFEILDSSTWKNGKFEFIANGKSIGNYDRGTSIEVAIAGLKRLLLRSSQRANGRLFSLTATEAISTVHRALFEDDGRTDDEIERDSRTFSAFHVSGFCDSFDDWFCILIENEEVGRLIWSEFAKLSKPMEVVLEHGEFDAVCLGCIDAFAAQYGGQ